VKRLLFAAFLGLVACGISFYLILFCSLSFYLFIKGVNPAEAPGLLAALRHVALPISAALGVLAFLVGLRRNESRALPADR
jgi:hypothetical protein